MPCRRSPVYACITYGSKSIPVVTLTALTCAEATHTELEVGGVYYGEVKRENGRVLSARLYDMAALYQLSGWWAPCATAGPPNKCSIS